MYVSTWIDKRHELLTIAEQVKQKHPDAWEELKVHGQASRRFINLVSIAGQAAGYPVGVNLKRGGPQESLDAIALPNPTGARDSTGRYAGIEIIDIVGNAEREDAALAWGDVTQKTIDSGNPGGWKAGSLTTGSATPTAPQTKPYPGDSVFLTLGATLEADYTEAGQRLNAGSAVWFSRTIWRHVHEGMTLVQSTAQSRKEWRAALGLPPWP